MAEMSSEQHSALPRATQGGQGGMARPRHPVPTVAYQGGANQMSVGGGTRGGTLGPSCVASEGCFLAPFNGKKQERVEELL